MAEHEFKLASSYSQWVENVEPARQCCKMSMEETLTKTNLLRAEAFGLSSSPSSTNSPELQNERARILPLGFSDSSSDSMSPRPLATLIDSPIGIVINTGKRNVNVEREEREAKVPRTAERNFVKQIVPCGFSSSPSSSSQFDELFYEMHSPQIANVQSSTPMEISEKQQLTPISPDFNETRDESRSPCK